MINENYVTLDICGILGVPHEIQLTLSIITRNQITNWDSEELEEDKEFFVFSIKETCYFPPMVILTYKVEKKHIF